MSRKMSSSKVTESLFIACVILVTSGTVFCQSVPDGTSGLRAGVYVTDRTGRPVTGLAQEDFEVSIGGSSVRITGCAEVDEPWSVLFVVDDSGSVQNDPRYGQVSRLWEKKIREFAETGNPGNEYGAIVFGQNVEEIMSWTPYSRDVFDRSLQRLHQDRKRKGSALYDAMNAATGLFGSSSRANRAIIVIGDGGESGSRLASLKDLIKKLRTHGIAVFTVNILELFEDPIFPGADYTRAKVLSPVHYENIERYEKLARETGGIGISAKKGEDIDSIFQILGYALRNRYRISVEPIKADRDLRIRLISRNPVLKKLDLVVSYRLEK